MSRGCQISPPRTPFRSRARATVWFRLTLAARETCEISSGARGTRLALPGDMRPSSLLILSLFTLAACDETSESVRHDYVDRHSDAFLYEGTTHDYVMVAVRSVLGERGYTVSPTEEAGGFKAMRTGKSPDEYSVHVVDLRWRRGFMVQLLHISRDKDGNVTSSYRDDKLEWEVIQRADPDKALQIMAAANAAADKVPPRTHREKN